MLTGGEGVGRADETGPDQAVADKLLGKGYGIVEDKAGENLNKHQNGHE